MAYESAGIYLLKKMVSSAWGTGIAGWVTGAAGGSIGQRLWLSNVHFAGGECDPAGTGCAFYWESSLLGHTITSPRQMELIVTTAVAVVGTLLALVVRGFLLGDRS